MGYHDETSTLSRSQFDVFLESPEEYEGIFLTGKLPKRQRTAAMDLGTICHAILLEKKKLDDLVRVYPGRCLNRNGGLIGAKAKEFRQKIFPTIPVKEETIEQVNRIVDSVLNSELGELLSGPFKFEHRLDANIEGVDCRCKPDIHHLMPDVSTLVYDLKFTEMILPDDWWRNAKNFGYAIQDAFYSLVAGKHYNAPVTFRFWAIETTGLCRVKPYWYDQRSREIAVDFVKRKLAEFADRKARNHWKDDFNQSGSIGPWDLGQNDLDEIVEFEG